ncbi:MAG: hypothetical protein M1606_01925 [Candidatus Thermoplasmatota archaeon]|nr:hypothetical protein [Candidatus Thermoplasmatota archaeon]MCL5983409.1 hypothetical protein [Candidatus Thermoplasmatota archaeon]
MGGTAPSESEPPREPLLSIAWKILLGGLLLREAFSFWTGSTYDFEVWLRTAHAVAQGFNPYTSFLGPVPGVSYAYLTTRLPSAAYLPFWSGILGELYRAWEVIGGNNRFVLYFLIKQLPILGDVLTAGLLYRLVLRWTGDRTRALAVLTFWSFFPYAIIIFAIWGQFDSIVVATILATLLYRDPIERNLLYGWGIFVKWITAIYLPFEIFRSRGLRRWTFLLALALPLGLTVAVFFLEGWSFAGISATAQSQTAGGGGGMTYVGILTGPVVSTIFKPIPYLFTALSYLYVPGVILAGWVASRWVGSGSPKSEVRALLLITTVFLLLRWGLYEQYMPYLFALLALDVAAFHPGREPFLRYLWLLSLVYLLFNNDFGARFVTPLDPSLFTTLTYLDQTLTYGAVRIWALDILDIGITLSLVQWIFEVLRDRDRPIPWLWPWGMPATEPGASAS